jgi:hypothetical protein
MKYVARIFFFCSIGLFLASLILPAFSLGAGNTMWSGQWSGAMVFLLGWGGILLFGSSAAFTWLANPLLLAAWIMASRCSKELPLLVFSFAFSLLAVIFSAAFLQCDGIYFGNFHNAERQFIPLVHLHIGYWLWLSSTIVMLIGTSIQMIILYLKRNQESGERSQESEQQLLTPNS